MAPQNFEICRPADMHLHLRQGKTLQIVTPVTARNYGYAVIMPNTAPPITSIEQCIEYRKEIYRATGSWSQFTPLMTAYINADLTPDELKEGFKQGVWAAAKLYPRGGTTGSEQASESIRDSYPLFEVMQEIGMPLLIHGEVVGPSGREYSRWTREGIFSAVVLPELQADFPNLKKVCEHVSTKELVMRVMRDETGYTAATITPHHALLIDGKVGQYPDAVCMPIIKGPEDRDALQEAMISGDARFFAGTDSAPHHATNKYCQCCSFGAFVAPYSVEAYASVFFSRGVFEEKDGVQRFEKFMSLNGPSFYDIPPARGKITLLKNTHEQKCTERFIIPGEKILEPSTEIVPLFHESLKLAPDFPYVVGGLANYAD